MTSAKVYEGVPVKIFEAEKQLQMKNASFALKCSPPQDALRLSEDPPRLFGEFFSRFVLTLQSEWFGE